MSLNLDPIDNLVLDDSIKGVPPGVSLRLSEVADRRWNLLRGDLPLPCAVIRESALEHNSRWMQHFVAQSGAVLAPHVKTTMCPAIIKRQLDDGAWAVTVATLQQYQVCRRYGANRVILANQIVGDLELDALARDLAEHRDLDLFMLVDSLEGIGTVASAARRAGLTRPFQLLLERGYTGGRAGCRDNASAMAIARAVKGTPGVILCGIEAFEGLIRADDAKAEAVGVFLDEIVALFTACLRENLFACDPPILTAGGSTFYDVVLDRLGQANARVVTRSGCYISHDSGQYEVQQQRILRSAGLHSGLRNALEVWTYVQSRPEPAIAILTAGRRDCGTDAGLPNPIAVSRQGSAPEPLEGATAYAINDQHLYVKLALGTDMRTGDRVALGVSHPCTTFDKWSVLYLVDDNYRVKGALKTYF
jgi:D-serine dehydratase